MSHPKNESPAQYAVLGSPISHSLSPEIHQAFAQATGQSMTYSAIEVKPEIFDEFWQSDRGRALSGANITMPLKEVAFEYCDELSQRAHQAGAVNTILKTAEGKLYGDNTDGIGLVNDLINNHKLELAERNILIIGAGGAAKGVLAPLLSQQPKNLWIWNRTPQRAMNLARQFEHMGPIQAIDADELSTRPVDAVINAAAGGHTGQTPDLNVIPMAGCWAYDLSYGGASQPFINWMEELGISAADGLGMLVEQAAASFQLWRDILPSTSEVLASLKLKFNC